MVDLTFDIITDIREESSCQKEYGDKGMHINLVI